MRSSLLAIVWVCLYMPLFASEQEPREITSTIRDVTVFLTGAEIKRSANADLQTGINVLLFTHLSSNIDVESIQATASGSVKVMAVDKLVDHNYIEEKIKDEVRLKKLNDSIAYLTKEIKRLGYEKETYESEKSMLRHYDRIGTGETGLTVLELQKLLEAYRNSLLSINKKIYTLDLKISEHVQLQAKYKAAIANLKVAGKKITDHQIKVTLHAAAAASSNIRLKYLVGGAGWGPKYNIQVADVRSEIEIEYKAHVVNQTGINWDNVKLTLSSALPLESQEKPALQPWTLNYRNRTTYEGRLDNYRPKTVSKEVAQRQHGSLKILEGVEYAEIDIPSIGMEFDIKDKYSIPADSKPYLIDVETYRLPATYVYYAIPKVDQDAFLLAQITGWEKLNLLEGKTNIYFKGTYIGHSYIRPQYANDTLDISLGRDNKVIFNRVKVEDKHSKKVIGLHKKETFTYKITARNTNKNKVLITLIDQVPVSQENDIEVDLVELSEARRDTLSGQLKWRFELKPGKAKEFTVSFSVKYPKNKQVHIRRSRRIKGKISTPRFYAP